MAILVQITENKSINERHPHVKIQRHFPYRLLMFVGFFFYTSMYSARIFRAFRF